MAERVAGLMDDMKKADSGTREETRSRGARLCGDEGVSAKQEEMGRGHEAGS